MRRELLLERISPDFLAELQQVPESIIAVDEAFGYDRAYLTFFGTMTTEQKVTHISRFECEGLKVSRLRARIWRLCDTFELTEDQVLDRLVSGEDLLKKAYWEQMRLEFYRQAEKKRFTRHHIIPKARQGTRRRMIALESEVHQQLHAIFGVMLEDEKTELIRWYERPQYEIVGDSRIPYRHHPNERLLLKNVRAGIMNELFSKRLSIENELRAARSLSAAA